MLRKFPLDHLLVDTLLVHNRAKMLVGSQHTTVQVRNFQKSENGTPDIERKRRAKEHGPVCFEIYVER